jgi:hypothetical protein
VHTISSVPKAISTVNISRKYQGTKRATVLTCTPYEAQLELQGGKKKAKVLPQNLDVATKKLNVKKQILGSVICVGRSL